MVGSGAVVNKDVPAHALVVGNPAKAVGFVYKNGERVKTEHLLKVDDTRAVFMHPESQEELSLALSKIKILPI